MYHVVKDEKTKLYGEKRGRVKCNDDVKNEKKDVFSILPFTFWRKRNVDEGMKQLVIDVPMATWKKEKRNSISI